MRKIEYWESFDKKKFCSEEECVKYESEHPFTDQNKIRFYSNTGNLINDPRESVWLDSNRFRVYDLNTLQTYIDYCKNLHIEAPYVPAMILPFPLSYHFMNGKWECIEETIKTLELMLVTSFNDSVLEEYANCHMLVGETEE